jgi:hypothetical protein
MTKKTFLITFIAVFCLFTYSVSDTPAEAISFPDPTLYAVQYGDAYSYSLPYLDALVDLGWLSYDPGTFTIHSSPGWIKDGIVIYTGSKGKPVTTNPAGMDGAMPAVSGNGAGDTTFDSSIDYLGETWPDGAWDQAGSWDASLSAFVGALSTLSNPNPTNTMFFFNNNQQNSGSAADQSLYAYGRITFTGDSPVDKVYEFINKTGGGDPTTYAWDGGEPDPWNSRLDPGEFVLSPGWIDFGPPIGGLNHNLGANLAAYAIYFPEIDFQWLLTNGYDEMHADFRLRDLNNGHEQLFVLLDDGSGQVPEPGTLVLLGSGLIGLAIYSRRKLKG